MTVECLQVDHVDSGLGHLIFVVDDRDNRKATSGIIQFHSEDSPLLDYFQRLCAAHDQFVSELEYIISSFRQTPFWSIDCFERPRMGGPCP